MKLDEHLEAKTDHNGPFTATAEFAQGLKFMLRRGPHWDALPSESKEALENIATRIAMLLHGDHGRTKHWNKIAGWARLRGAQLEELDDEIAAALTHAKLPRAVDEPFNIASKLAPRRRDGGTPGEAT